MAYGYRQNIVIDLEFNPVDRELRTGDLTAEIIEIGAVRTDAGGSVVDSFCTMVRPEVATVMNRGVSRLTGISGADLVDAPLFEEALSALCSWIGEPDGTRVVAWSPTDRGQVLAECAAKGVGVPLQLSRWLDLQQVYPRVMQVGREGRRMPLKEAVAWSGVQIDAEEQHRALYDARCTAELFRLIKSNEYTEQLEAYDTYIAPSKPDEREVLSSNPMAEALKGFFD